MSSGKAGSAPSTQAPNAEVLDGLLAHNEFLDFACDSHREGIYYFDVAGNFVVGNLAFAVLPHFSLSDLLARLYLDPGHDFFAVLGVGDADNLYVADLGMGVSEYFSTVWSNRSPMVRPSRGVSLVALV